jgi:prepilin-type N-terminal cleavage/methylation domain-containing protein
MRINRRKDETRYRRQGMTLLEVIVAMTVLAIGIVGVLGAISACVRSNDAAAAYSRAAILAQQVAAEFDRQSTLDEGDQTGTFDDTATDYSWDAQVAAANAQGLYPVQITVSWEKDKHHYTLYTMLLPRTLPTATSPTPPTTGGGGATASGGAVFGAAGSSSSSGTARPSMSGGG